MPDPFAGLRVVDVLGTFYRENGRLLVADEFEGVRDVDAMLADFVDMQVRILAHHRPREPHDSARWGGGCCYLENTGQCHFGHHEDPSRLFVFDGGGILKFLAGRWKLDDTEMWLDALLGHRSQIVVMTAPDVDVISEGVAALDPDNMTNPTLDDLLERLRQTRDFVEQINDLKSKIDG